MSISHLKCPLDVQLDISVRQIEGLNGQNDISVRNHLTFVPTVFPAQVTAGWGRARVSLVRRRGAVLLASRTQSGGGSWGSANLLRHPDSARVCVLILFASVPVGAARMTRTVVESRSAGRVSSFCVHGG